MNDWSGRRRARNFQRTSNSQSTIFLRVRALGKITGDILAREVDTVRKLKYVSSIGKLNSGDLSSGEQPAQKRERVPIRGDVSAWTKTIKC